MRIALLAGSLALSLWLALASVAAGPASAPARPDVLVYLIDTLRPDHLGAYGYARETSPAIDALARDGVLFERAYAPSAWTKPSTASLLTGLSPARHGAQTRRRRLAEEHVLVSETLRGLGYHTAGFVTNPHVVSYWGFAQGYDVYQDIGGGADWTRTGADQVNARVLAHMADGLREPFFYYLHTIDPHAPYDPRPPYATRWSERPAPVQVGELPADSPAPVLEHMRAMYDAEIYANDVEFGKLVAALRERGLYDRTLIVVTSDHGEEHFEHGRGGHGQQLFEESVRVPLIVKLPGQRHAGRRVATRVSLLDVVPSLLGWVGGADGRPRDGVDLGPLLDGAAEPSRALFFELEFERGVVRPEGTLTIARAILEGNVKYLEQVVPSARRLLFDLGADPGERDDLSERRPFVRQRLAASLEREQRSTAAGLHLRLASAGGDPPAVIEGRLTTAGRFVALRGVELEAEDSATVADGGRALELRAVLRDYPREPGSAEQIQDIDGVVVELEPPGADVVVERLRASGDAAAVPIRLGPARSLRRSLPLVVSTGAPDLVAPEVEALFAAESQARTRVPPGAFVVRVPPAATAEAEGPLPDNLRERLRSLGYLEDPD